jgi:type VI secretion system lysozyme-like protein
MRTRGIALFDRFLVCTEDDWHAGGGSATDVGVVEQSIDALLNTRSPFSLSDCEMLERRSVIDYGMPDFLHLSPLSRVATHRLARVVHDTIAAHEPRFAIRAVDVEMPRPCRDAFRVLISGEIKVDDTRSELVTFPVEVH